MAEVAHFYGHRLLKKWNKPQPLTHIMGSLDDFPRRFTQMMNIEIDPIGEKFYEKGILILAGWRCWHEAHIR